MQVTSVLALVALCIGGAVANQLDHPLALLNRGSMLGDFDSSEESTDHPYFGDRPDLDKLFTCEGLNHFSIYLFIKCADYYSADTRCFNAKSLFEGDCNECAQKIQQYTRLRIDLDCEDYTAEADYSQCPPGFNMIYGECFEQCNYDFECCQDGEHCVDNSCRRDHDAELQFLHNLDELCASTPPTESA